MTVQSVISMATQKELDTLFKLQDIVCAVDEDGEYHHLQEQGTYAQGVSDCLRILLKRKTLKEILNR